jgi:hypothetical protein
VVRARHVGGLQHQRRDSAGVPDGHLQRRRAAGGTRVHDRPVDAEHIQQRRVGVGLQRHGGVPRHRRAEVAEARRCDEPVPGQHVRIGEPQAGVVAAEDAVHEEDREPGSLVDVLDPADARIRYRGGDRRQSLPSHA